MSDVSGTSITITSGQVFNYNNDRYIILVVGIVPGWYLIHTGGKHEEPYWTKITATTLGQPMGEDKEWLNTALFLAHKYDVLLQMTEQ